MNELYIKTLNIQMTTIVSRMQVFDKTWNTRQIRVPEYNYWSTSSCSKSFSHAARTLLIFYSHSSVWGHVKLTRKNATLFQHTSFTTVLEPVIAIPLFLNVFLSYWRLVTGAAHYWSVHKTHLYDDRGYTLDIVVVHVVWSRATPIHSFV